MKKKLAPNNIAFRRRRRNYSQTRVSEMTGIPTHTLSRIEAGKTEDWEIYRKKIAAALACDPADLDGDPTDLPTVPIAKEVKVKSAVVDVAGKEVTQEIEGLPATTEALHIRTHGLAPYHSYGDILYYDAKPQTKAELYLNRECLVVTARGKQHSQFLAWVLPGSETGKCTLQPYLGSLSINVKPVAIHPILHIKKV